MINKIACCLFVILSYTTVLYGQVKTLPAIKSVKAFLYYNEDDGSNKTGGTLSENIIDNPDFSLWNVIIGEGAASAPSRNTFVVVEIMKNNSEISDGILKLTAYYADGKLALRQEQRFTTYSEDKNCIAPFMLYDTGCRKLKLKIVIMDQSKKKIYASTEKTLDFLCGE